MIHEKIILSIIIPVFNAQETICRTLNSLQVIESQYRQFVQVVIVNDGSTDQTIIQVEQSMADLKGFSINLYHQENQGVSAARNLGLQNAKGKWVLLLDADDELALSPIDYLSDAVDTESISCFVFAVDVMKQSKSTPSQYQKLLTLKPKIFTKENLLDLFTSQCPCSISSILFRINLLKNPFNTQYHRLEDWLFWFENNVFFERSKTIKDACLSRVYIHSKNASANYRLWGIDRQKIANLLISKYGQSFTKKQINNLLLQIACGRCQEGKRMPVIGNYLRIPVSPVLYIKYVIYSVSAIFNFKATLYD